MVSAQPAIQHITEESRQMKIQILPRFFAFLCVMVGALSVAAPAAPVLFLGLTVYAFRGARQSMEVLGLLAFLLLINKGLAPIGSTLSIFRWVVLFTVFGRLLWDHVIGEAPLPPILIPVGVFSLTIFLFSVLTSYLPLVSSLKVITFAVGVGAALAGLHRTMHLREFWFSWLFTLGFFILVASTTQYVTPYGYMRNGTGFQGILNHPQVYGSVASVITTFLTGLVFFEKNESKLARICLFIGWVGIFTSQSRTAFLSVTISLVIVLLIGFLANPSWRSMIAGAIGRTSTIIGLGFVVVFVIAQWATIEQGIQEFLLKDDSDTSVVESLQSSRMKLFERSMTNFKNHPVTGIGFGVPSAYPYDPNASRVETGAFGLPIGASVEKGFMPSAVLEETGSVGAILVTILILSLLWPVYKYSSISFFWMILTCLMINLGEMVFFSVGGLGMFLWFIMAFCHTYAWALRPRPQAIKRRYSYR